MHFAPNSLRRLHMDFHTCYGAIFQKHDIFQTLNCQQTALSLLSDVYGLAFPF